MSAPSLERPGGLDAQNPWPGLEQFREEDAGFFRGRGAETDELLSLVRRERLTVLFGLSGLGKSSLLQAGLFPALRAEQYLPVFLRIAYDERGPSPRAQLLAALAHASAAEEIESPESDEEASLWEHFHRQGAAYWTADNQPVSPVLVLDQFEEAFTLGRQTPGRAALVEAFLQELADLVEGRVPASLRAKLDADPAAARSYIFNRHPYKVLIAIREDFLAELEMLRPRMPSLAGNRMRLVALRADAALAVTQTGGAALVSPEVGERIVRLVGSTGTGLDASRRDLRDVVVDPALLSLFCRELNERRKMLGQESISTALVEGNRESILGDFYERSVGDLGPVVRRLVEDRLITEVGGYRDSLALENALAIPGVSNGMIDTLVERRLVRREEREGRTRLELTHDVLTDVVRGSRDARRNQEELERAREEGDRQAAALARARREVQRARIAVTVMTLLALVAIAAGISAVRQGRAARRSADEANRALATSDFLDATRLANATDAPEALARLARSMRRMPESAASRALAFSLLKLASPPLGLFPSGGRVNSAAFSPDGRRVITASEDFTAQVWDAATGKKVGPPLKHTGYVWSAAFSPDGRRIVTAAEENRLTGANAPLISPIYPSRVQEWDAATGEKVGPSMTYDLTVSHAVFSADGQRILAAGYRDKVLAWDASAGQQVEPTAEQVQLVLRATSPDGRRVAMAHDSMVSVWEAATLKSVGPNIRVGATVNNASFSPDGRLIVTASGDRTAQVWDATTGERVGLPLRHAASVNSAVFSPDGRWIVTASDDHTAQLWRTPAEEKPLPTLKAAAQVSDAVLSPDGQRIVTAVRDSTAQLWDAVTGRKAGAPLRNVGPLWRAAISPDGQRIVTTTLSGTAQLWDVVKGAKVGPSLERGMAVRSVAFSPDGRRILIASDDSTAGFMDNGGATAQQVDAASGRAIGPAMRHPDNTINTAVFSPDGRRIVTASQDFTAQVWDAASGKKIGPALRHADAVYTASFSPDGRWIVTASNDSTAQVWDAATGQRVGPPLRHESEVMCAAFSPDGQRIVTAAGGVGRVQLWDAATGRKLGPPMQHQNFVSCARFTADGQRVLTAVFDSTARLWDARTGTPDDAEPLATLAEVVAHRRLTPTGAIIAIAPDSEAALLASLREQVQSSKTAPSGSYLEFLRWYLADPSTRAVYAGAPSWGQR